MKIYGTAASAEAPETTAPSEDTPTSGTDTPVAPQTFDMGILAAAAAVISAAGYALTKKR